MYGNGEQGLIGYLRWVARYHPRTFMRGLTSVLRWEFLQGDLAEEPRRTLAEINEQIREDIGRASKAEPKSPSGWTQDFLVGELMQAAVENPKAFCKLFNTALLRPPTAWHRRARTA